MADRVHTGRWRRWRPWMVTLLLTGAALAMFWFLGNYVRLEPGDTASEVAQGVVASFPPAGADLVLIDHNRVHGGRGESFIYFDPDHHQLLVVHVEPFFNLGWQYRSYRRIRLPEWLVRQPPIDERVSQR